AGGRRWRPAPQRRQVRASARPQYGVKVAAAGHAIAFLQHALRILEENARRATKTEVSHQQFVLIQPDLYFFRDRFRRLDSTLFVAFLIFVQGLLGMPCSEYRSGLGRRVGANDADQNMAQLHLACVHPWPCLMPESIAIRA